MPLQYWTNTTNMNIAFWFNNYDNTNTGGNYDYCAASGGRKRRGKLSFLIFSCFLCGNNLWILFAKQK